jgi:hypothetical protein
VPAPIDRDALIGRAGRRVRNVGDARRGALGEERVPQRARFAASAAAR